MGCIIGMQAIDMCFDLAIINNSNVSDGSIALEARRVAYFYYHRVLNASHVNGLLLAMVLCSCLGPTLGMVRGTPEVQRRFIYLAILSSIGSGSYMAVVMPRYLVIRAADYRPELFDGWEKVLAARMMLYTSTILSLRPLHALQALAAEVRDEEGPIKKGC
jgi:hypothetical protein